MDTHRENAHEDKSYAATNQGTAEARRNPRTEPSPGLPGEHGSADASILNNKFLLFKPLGMWSVVTAAPTN